MAEIVTGTPAIVGFTNGHNDYNRRGGWEFGDYAYARAVDAGEQTRDIIKSVYDSVVATEKIGAAGVLATEKIGAAAELTAEKIGMANLLATEKIGNANSLATQLGFKDLAMQLAECCCDIKKDVADVKATVLSVDAHRIRDDLAEARAELLAMRSRGNGNGN